WIAIAIGFGGALAVTIDQAGERGAPHFAQAEVYARNVLSDHDGNVTRQLHVAPWGAQPATIFNVDAATYDAFREVENICPQSHRGLLGIGWFRLARCPRALLAVTRPRPPVGEWSRFDLGVFPLLLLISVGLLARAGGAVADGRIDERDGSYTRRGQPVDFWLSIALLAGGGTILLIFATVLGLRMLA
ncbi:MAG TPA: hypothetical protein VK980_03905, partial [Sphingomonas sp.]|nr:hypothetical protein [Sphingomonas sp.]